MPKWSSKDVAFLLVDGFNILGSVTELTTNTTALTEETSPLGVEWNRHEALDRKAWEASQNGFFEAGTGSVHEALTGSEGLARVVCVGFEGNTVGAAFTGAGGIMALGFQKVAEREAFMKANATYRASGAVEEGVILLPHGATSGDADDGPVHDHGSATADGGVAYLQVTALDLGGYDELTVVVQHSADNVTFTDLATFAVVDDAPGAQRLPIGGEIQRYTRVHWQYEGTGTDPVATIMVGLARA